jgi:1-acyl-sn-glycerol-3-phosphate acyltransferase
MDASEANNASAKPERVDNTQLQAETFGALKSGRMLCLFPEGTSHSEAHILKLKGQYTQNYLTSLQMEYLG